MKADYDSEADSILISIVEVDGWDHEVIIDSDEYCRVATREERPVSVSLRFPREEIDLLAQVARRFELSEIALRATTGAALAAPDHLVTVDVDPQVLAGSRPAG